MALSITSSLVSSCGSWRALLASQPSLFDLFFLFVVKSCLISTQSSHKSNCYLCTCIFYFTNERGWFSVLLCCCHLGPLEVIFWLMLWDVTLPCMDWYFYANNSQMLKEIPIQRFEIFSPCCSPFSGIISCKFSPISLLEISCLLPQLSFGSSYLFPNLDVASEKKAWAIVRFTSFVSLLSDIIGPYYVWSEIMSPLVLPVF